LWIKNFQKKYFSEKKKKSQKNKKNSNFRNKSLYKSKFIFYFRKNFFVELRNSEKKKNFMRKFFFSFLKIVNYRNINYFN
jgi:hypothetical protein